MEGQIFGGRYLVGETLGAGGMGIVYRATDLRTGGLVAIKIPHPWLTVHADYVTRLQREAQIAASLTSSRIVKVMDFDWHDGRPFLVMEYVPGQTLAEPLVERGAFTWQETVRIGLEVARALEAAHRSGIVHRDLKPQNIKIGEDGDIKVLDFGIARSDSLPAMTAASVVVGTPQYLAPERLGGLHEDDADGTLSHGDARSDIYAFGVILYEMVTGRPPFPGPSHWSIIRSHVSEPPPPLPASVPPALARIIARCLEKRPADRYPTATELAAALREITVVGPSATPSQHDTAEVVNPGRNTGATTPFISRRGVLTPVMSSPQAISGATTPWPAPGDSPAGRTMIDMQMATATAPSVRAAPARPGRGRSGRALLLLAGGALVALAVVSGIIISGIRGGTSDVADSGGGQAAEVTTATPETAVPTPMPTAAPVRVTDLGIYPSGADFLAGQPAVVEFVAGTEAVACYGFAGAGNGTMLTIGLTDVDRGPLPSAASDPFAPTTGDDIRCELLLGAPSLAPGPYAIEVRDRGQPQARTEFSVTAPPTPTPPPTAAPAAVQTAVTRPAAVSTRPPTVAQTPPPPPPTVVRTPVPEVTTAPPPTESPPTPPARTPLPTPKATGVPGM